MKKKETPQSQPCAARQRTPAHAQCSLTRIPTDKHEGSPLYDALINIESEQPGGDSAFRRQRFDHKAAKYKVLRPLLLARIEEWNKPAGIRVKRTNVTTFPGVAAQTRISEIICCGQPSMLSTNDVIYLMGRV